MSDLGDFLLENDQIRVNILNAKGSPGPGVFGGSIVDVDVRRERVGDENNQGHDRFAELFPIANLLVPDPRATQVRVLKDGKDGAEASIRVDGEGAKAGARVRVVDRQAGEAAVDLAEDAPVGGEPAHAGAV